MPQPEPLYLTRMSVGRKPRLSHSSLTMKLCLPSQSEQCMGHSLLKNPTTTPRPTQQVADQPKT